MAVAQCYITPELSRGWLQVQGMQVGSASSMQDIPLLCELPKAVCYSCICMAPASSAGARSSWLQQVLLQQDVTQQLPSRDKIGAVRRLLGRRRLLLDGVA
jgi:hypothetical protein